MALDAALRERILRLTPEEKAEVNELLLKSDEAQTRQEFHWLEAVRSSQEAFAREGVTIDSVAEVREIRDEI